MMQNFLIKSFVEVSAKKSNNLVDIETVYIHVTKQCNLNCNYCYYYAGAKEDSELTTSEIKMIINELPLFNPKRIVFTGGEPLLRNDIIELATSIKHVSKDIILGISTNGFLITQSIAFKLVSLFDEIRISIDGPREINDSQRGQDSFDKAMKAFKFIIEAGGNPSAFITVSIANIFHLKEFMKYLLSNSINKIHISPLKNIGRAKDKKLSCKLVELKKEVEQFYFEQFGLKMEHGTSESLNCGVGKYISINSDGSVYPCHILSTPEFCIGNIKNERLSDIINNSLIMFVLRNSKFNEIPKCNICLMDLPEQTDFKN
jgi:radical SAM protein with 4Fe4S-binding SPASM domain